MPRSGSTWLGELFNSNPEVVYRYQPLFSYAFRDRLTNTSTLEEINLFFSEIRKSEDQFINQIEARQEGKLPKFKGKTSCKAIIYKEVRYHHILKHILKRLLNR